MSTTPTPTRKAATMTILRTFETFEIHWSDMARWTGYDSAAEAQAVVDSPGIDRTGEVVRKTWEVQISPELEARGLYMPGYGDRVVAL